MLTPASLRQLRQTKESVVTRHRLEGDIAVPFVPSAATERVLALVELLSLRRADDADLVVWSAVLARRVADGVDVQTRGAGFACQTSQTVDQLLLQVISEAVLLAEEDDSSLGN